MNYFKTLLLLTSVMLLGACSTPKVAYFKDLQNGMTQDIQNALQIKSQPGDRLTIVVNSKDPELANLFNLPVQSTRAGFAGSLNYQQSLSSYTIDSKGYIDFPVVGKIFVSGKTREQISEIVKQKLISTEMVKDPVVTTDFVEMYINVLGEVTRPGRYPVQKDQVTLLEALSTAGDLTIYGRRDNVQVIRIENGQQTAYTVDLTSSYSLAMSPVYYLKQNDVVYVTPNNFRARQATVNGNNVRSTSFWISLASLLTSVAVLIFK